MPPAPRDREAMGGTTACPVSVSLTLSGQRRNRHYLQGGCNVESRLQTPFDDEVASAHCCDDEGKEDDRRDDMQRASHSCDGPLSRSAKALSLADEAGAILPSNCFGGRSNRIYN